jgi:hypothetical protein
MGTKDMDEYRNSQSQSSPLRALRNQRGVMGRVLDGGMSSLG